MRDLGGPSVFAAVAAGGALGTLARYGVGLLAEPVGGGLPVGTLGVNVLGCLLIGVLTAVLAAEDRHRLWRPFLGTGVLGGFTTFSAYAVDVQGLIVAGHTGTALLSLVGTLVAAVAATVAGRAVGLRMVRAR
ncbi:MULTISPECIES: fluoride efflux transporter CrcB [Actinoalloteichus]|uniref:Fluoride-specific ion channel FluC n=1 Tax=Actinoalloteichus fjordicus TaxID=1612552 RepID=A0AAC9L7B6_9PSEU|nr:MULTISPECIES: fluoride efflux transporter CrcB [Actinoalloteichus]APU12492.1 protein CrcB [Actinoalloteichus fjordicus]APU18445.1 protein CrcB [Actinoalloteichus sp. GBA129-24]